MPGVLIPKSRISAGGFVDAFDVPSGQWVRRNPVDVREGIAAGTILLNGPSIELTGPGGNRKVPALEAPRYLAAGYSLVTKTDTTDGLTEEQVRRQLPPAHLARDPADFNKADPKPASNPNEPPKYDFSAHNLEDLRGMAKAAGIKNAKGMSQEELADALDKSGWRPA